MRAAGKRAGDFGILPGIQPPRCFPYCLVWTPIPVLSWLVPVVGHVGICSSDGTIYDFAGSKFVNTGSLAFGNPTRYWQLDPAEASGLITQMQTRDIGTLSRPWDNALLASKHAYQQQQYKFLENNCHSFAAYMLSQVQYGGNSQWNMVIVAAESFRHSRYVGVSGLVKTWTPSAVLAAACIYFLGVFWLFAWLGVLASVCLALFVVVNFMTQQDAPAVYRAVTV